VYWFSPNPRAYLCLLCLPPVPVRLSLQTQPMRFVPLSKQSGWFTVKLVDIRMGPTLTADGGMPPSVNFGVMSLGLKEATYNTGECSGFS